MQETIILLQVGWNMLPGNDFIAWILTSKNVSLSFEKVIVTFLSVWCENLNVKSGQFYYLEILNLPQHMKHITATQKMAYKPVITWPKFELQWSCASACQLRCVTAPPQVLEEDSGPAGSLRRLWRLSLLFLLQRKAWDETFHFDAAWLLCPQRHVAHSGQGQGNTQHLLLWIHDATARLIYPVHNYYSSAFLRRWKLCERCTSQWTLIESLLCSSPRLFRV